jgi:hypothetical protein
MARPVSEVLLDDADDLSSTRTTVSICSLLMMNGGATACAWPPPSRRTKTPR